MADTKRPGPTSPETSNPGQEAPRFNTQFTTHDPAGEDSTGVEQWRWAFINDAIRQGASGATYALGLTLAAYATPGGQDIDRLGTVTGLPRKTVTDGLTWLKNHGWVDRQYRLVTPAPVDGQARKDAA